MRTIIRAMVARLGWAAAVCCAGMLSAALPRTVQAQKGASSAGSSDAKLSRDATEEAVDGALLTLGRMGLMAA